jgi:signal transduction histidine kinase
MNLIQKHLVALLLMAVSSAGADLPASGTPALKERSLPELQQRLAAIDAELGQLASFTVRGGTGSVGYYSSTHRDPDAKESIRVELAKESTIEEVVLVPVLFRHAKTGLQSAGFPVAFRVLVGTGQTTHEVASFSEEDQLLPRIGPLTISFPPVKASWVSIEASTLSSMLDSDSVYRLALSEIMAFSGKENVALPLQKSEGTKRSLKNHKKPRETRFLIDGFSPYLMDAGDGKSSQTKVIRIKSMEAEASLNIDLKTSQPVHQINLHTADVSFSIPMREFSCWAVPRHVRVTGANESDFSDEMFLCEFEQHSIYDNGPILMRPFMEKRCRYIRLTIIDPRPVVSFDQYLNGFAFSEIEVLSHSQNIAQGAPVTGSSGLSYRRGALERITDGLNNYGEILPLREWMNQLARRHDLERERPLVVAELNRRYDSQQTNLRRMIWLAAVLAVGILFTVLISRMLRQRSIFQTRERIAANLHDELGANLHAIGILGDLAKQEVSDAGADERWATLNHYINETRTLTEQTAKMAKHCTNMLEAHEIHENLVEEMKNTGERLLADLEHNLSFTDTNTDTDSLQRLHPRRRIGLYLFYKESLTNIIRHARATRVETHLTADKNRISLIIHDNGIGGATPPPSLKRRARLLKANLSVESPADGGTKITLWFRPRRRLRRKQPRNTSL